MTPAPTNFLYSTSGGGTTSSSQYELRISIGAPSSHGAAENNDYRIQVAPVSP